MIRTIDSNEARNHWREILDAGARGQDIVITRYGKPVSVLVDYADYAAIVEELDDMRAGRRAQAALEEWERDPATARPYAEFRAELVAEGLLDADEPTVG